MRNGVQGRGNPRSSEAGLTLLETTIAMGILMLLTAGLMTLGTTAAITTENQGHLVARATEYAQDKIEQLVALPFCNGLDNAGANALSGVNTTVWPPTVGGGTGLATGGSSNPDAPVNGYVDYLDGQGNLLGGGAVAPAGWFYKRVWAIAPLACAMPPDPCAANPPTCTLKQITVTATVRSGVAGDATGNFADSTLTTIKSHPF